MITENYTRNFFVNNIKPLGCYTNIIAETVPRGSCDDSLNLAIDIFNVQLRESLSHMRTSSPTLLSYTLTTSTSCWNFVDLRAIKLVRIYWTQQAHVVLKFIMEVQLRLVCRSQRRVRNQTCLSSSIRAIQLK